MPKDLSLLRPFNLQKALNGETVCTSKGVTFPVEFNNLRMAPLCWIEDKPVYKGDVLYWRTDGSQFTVVGPLKENGHLVGDSICNSGHVYKGSIDNTGMYPSSLTWTKPKQKKQGWINVYPKERSYWYPTKEKADQMAGVERITCVPFEYEE